MKSDINIIPYPFYVEEKNDFLAVSKNDGFLLVKQKERKGTDPCEQKGTDPELKEPEKEGTDPCDILLHQIKKTGYSCVCSTSEHTEKQSDGKKTLIQLISADEYKSYKLGEEAYVLDIATDKITIAASTDRGQFYGVISLCQLLMDEKNLPCVFIYDKPAFAWRGFMLDTCRTFFSVDFIKKMLEVSAFHKFNIFHWHLTDDQGWRLPVPEYPKLVEIGSKRMDHTSPEAEDGLYDEGRKIRRYYTEEEISEIVKYAAALKIEIVPEIEFPGHASALLAAYPELGCTGGPYQVEHRWGIFPDVVCLGNDKIFDLYDKTFAQVEKLFPGKYLHIGGDECLTTRWEKCPKCQARMKENHLKNPSQLQSWGTSKIAKLVLSHHKIPIGWDEVLDNTDLIPLPNEVIVQSWRGVEGGERASAMKHKVIMSPQTHCYMNLKNIDSFEEMGRLGVTTCEKAYSYTPVTEKMSESAAGFVLGGECTFWSEKIRASRIAEYLMFPRFCALAETMWTELKNKDFNRFEKIVEGHKNRLSKMDFIYFNGSLR